MQEGFVFVAQCYWQSNKGSSENRHIIWWKRQIVPKKSSKATTLKSLPPTDETLKENIKRAHYNAALWYNCITGIPPQMNPCDYGWGGNEDGTTLSPIMLPKGVPIAPEEVLKITHSKCALSKCKNNRCSCFKIEVKCTSFCGCIDCENEKKLCLSDNDATKMNKVM